MWWASQSKKQSECHFWSLPQSNASLLNGWGLLFILRFLTLNLVSILDFQIVMQLWVSEHGKCSLCKHREVLSAGKGTFVVRFHSFPTFRWDRITITFLIHNILTWNIPFSTELYLIWRQKLWTYIQNRCFCCLNIPRVIWQHHCGQVHLSTSMESFHYCLCYMNRSLYCLNVATYLCPLYQAIQHHKLSHSVIVSDI